MSAVKMVVIATCARANVCQPHDTHQSRPSLCSCRAEPAVSGLQRCFYRQSMRLGYSALVKPCYFGQIV